VLGTPHDAEDAFQAVFLVLACRAPSIRDPDLLGSWLYAVALRTARKARAQIARRRKTHETAMIQKPVRGEALLIDASVPTPEQTLLNREQAGILYSEIDRLPPSFRQPVVLHYFEGLTLDDTACRLSCPAGTVRSRLARACDKLRRGLMRRGVALSTAAVASALSSHSASADVSPALCETASRAAINFATHRAAMAGVIRRRRLPWHKAYCDRCCSPS
jgi:RNA polymerase sigma factor (sigma-70 family)